MPVSLDQPSTATLPSLASAGDDVAGERVAGVRQEARVLHRRGADDHVGHAGVEVALDRVEVADAAAELDRHLVADRGDISRITFSFFGRPAIAPFRSTMCRRFAPCAAQCLAIATGSSENTVAVLMSPCFRRTQRPSFRSIAGMMSTTVLYSRTGRTPHEVGEELQAGGLAFSGWNWTAKILSRATAQVKGAPYTQVAGGQRGRAAPDSSCARNRSGCTGCPARARASAPA